MKKLISDTVKNYLNYISEINFNFKHNIIIQGIPCPNVETKDTPEVKISELIGVIREFDARLKTETQNRGFGFLDVHTLTDNGSGFSNIKWHMDLYHLSPEGMQAAWRDYYIP